MKGLATWLLPPPPRILKVIDFRGFRRAVSCLESISFKLIDCKEVRNQGQRLAGNDLFARNTQYSNPFGQIIPRASIQWVTGGELQSD
jgi:hypothetical protein